MGYGLGLNALGILYWLKVKAVIISFFVGTAIVWGFRYFTDHHSKSVCPEVIREGPVIPYEGPSWPIHDHISYSSSPHHSSDFYPEHDPYSGYSSYGDSSPPEIIDSTSHPHRRRVSKGRQMVTEDQVSDMVFAFLGVGSVACRKRFLCEMEFRSNDNPLTNMAFRILGRHIFAKYVRNGNEAGAAQSFAECGKVHSDCVFIEEHIPEDETGETNEVESSTVLAENSETSTSAVVSRRGMKSVPEMILRRPNK